MNRVKYVTWPPYHRRRPIRAITTVIQVSHATKIETVELNNYAISYLSLKRLYNMYHCLTRRNATIESEIVKTTPNPVKSILPRAKILNAINITTNTSIHQRLLLGKTTVISLIKPRSISSPLCSYQTEDSQPETKCDSKIIKCYLVI